MFRDVEDNAQRQEYRFADTRSELIEDYYPELHGQQDGPFACTICSHLIPDLMTRRRILIDLDNLRSDVALVIAERLPQRTIGSRRTWCAVCARVARALLRHWRA